MSSAVDCREQGGACGCPAAPRHWAVDVYVRRYVVATCADEAERIAQALVGNLVGHAYVQGSSRAFLPGQPPAQFQRPIAGQGGAG